MPFKKYSIASLLLMLIASPGIASEEAVYSFAENTLTIPIVSVDDQGFYYLELSLAASESDISFNVQEAREIGPQDYSNAHYSTATSRLVVSNVDIGGDQWLINLDLAPDGKQFVAESLLLPAIDAVGNVLAVEYIDNKMSPYTYRFSEEGLIDTIDNPRLAFRFNDDNTVSVYANYAGYPIYGTHAGDMNADDVGSSAALSSFSRDMVHHHLSETTQGQEDIGTFADFDIDFQSIANALSRYSWVYACTSASVSSNSWDAIASACEEPRE